MTVAELPLRVRSKGEDGSRNRQTRKQNEDFLRRRMSADMEANIMV